MLNDGYILSKEKVYFVLMDLIIQIDNPEEEISLYSFIQVIDRKS
jgi:hypothetical protein